MIGFYETSNSYRDSLPLERLSGGRASPLLYKIVSVKHWEANDTHDPLPLTEEDSAFIHLATEEQLDAILDKYWALKNYVILKLDARRLPGHLVYEANPGGTNKYYHLYEGSLPRQAIVAVFADRHAVHYKKSCKNVNE